MGKDEEMSWWKNIGIEVEEEPYRFNIKVKLKLVDLSNLFYRGYGNIYAGIKKGGRDICIDTLYLVVDYDTLKEINKELTIKARKAIKKSKTYTVSWSPFLPSERIKMLDNEAIRAIDELTNSEEFKEYVKTQLFDILYWITNFLFRYLLNDLKEEEKLFMYKFGFDAELKKDVLIEVL